MSQNGAVAIFPATILLGANLIEIEWHQLKAHEICGRMFEHDQELKQSVINAVESRNRKKGMRTESFH